MAFAYVDRQTCHTSNEGVETLKSKFISALDNLNRNKTVLLDAVLTAVISALHDFSNT